MVCLLRCYREERRRLTCYRAECCPMSRRSGAVPSANGLGIGRTVLLLLLAGVSVLNRPGRRVGRRAPGLRTIARDGRISPGRAPAFILMAWTGPGLRSDSLDQPQAA